MRTSTIWTSAAIVLPLVLGCAPESDNDVTTAPLTQAGLTNAAPWVVRINFPTSLCSGSVLTEHWLLTAAHCVEGQPALISRLQVSAATASALDEVVYDGPARPYGHPDYGRFLFFTDAEDDIALVKLDAAAGIDLGKTGRAKLWGYSEASRVPFDAGRPWTSPIEEDRRFVSIGWGQGGDGDACVTGTHGVKRLGDGFALDRAGMNALMVSATTLGSHECPGDSGGPWLFGRGGELIAFALWVDAWPNLLLFGDERDATLIQPKERWMFEKSRDDGLELICGAGGTAGGATFLECNERRREPPPPPPPGTLCPTGRHCCDPSPDGAACLRCVANAQACP
jgi:hypothetical protein